jgi:hypothetical protein
LRSDDRSLSSTQRLNVSLVELVASVNALSSGFALAVIVTLGGVPSV